MNIFLFLSDFQSNLRIIYDWQMPFKINHLNLKKRKMNKLKLIFAVLFMSSFMFACGGSETKDGAADSTATDSTEKSAEEKPMEETPAPADSTAADSTKTDTTKTK